jgi:hypothetical protein
MPLDGVAETWWVKIAEKVYGPYSRDHMARFVAEGRVKASSLVALSSDGEWLEARNSPPLQAALNEARGQFKTDEAAGEPANVIVYSEIMSSATRQFEYELRRMGAVAEVNPGIYLVRTTRTAGAIRNAISPILSRGDKLLVMDATRDRLAWFNLGPETDARIREVWNAPLAVK